jgi:hypothetical protein
VLLTTPSTVVNRFVPPALRSQNCIFFTSHIFVSCDSHNKYRPVLSTTLTDWWHFFKMMPLCPPQIPHGPTRASAVRGRRLTAWAMERPHTGHLLCFLCRKNGTLCVISTNFNALKHPQNDDRRRTGNFTRRRPVHDLRRALKELYVYDDITKLCRQET